jgi:hypothetical protein
MFKVLLPHSPFCPATEPGMHHPKIAEPFRQIAPWNSSSIAIKNSLHKQPIIHRRTSYRTHPSWQHPFDPLPLIVPYAVAMYAQIQKLRGAAVPFI